MSGNVYTKPLLIVLKTARIIKCIGYEVFVSFVFAAFV